MSGFFRVDLLFLDGNKLGKFELKFGCDKIGTLRIYFLTEKALKIVYLFYLISCLIFFDFAFYNFKEGLGV